MRIGPHTLPTPLLLAPMAGITDGPFRHLCRRLGAGLAFSEMVTADAGLWSTPKSRFRLDPGDEPRPLAVQIAGTEPEQLANAARLSRERGADIIDINMGCPARKVCRKAAGAALLRDEALVGRILDAVLSAADGPVMLKIRTGWAPEERNAVAIARLAQSAGIAALTVHGRTRADGYRGHAEHDTLCRVRDAVDLPLIANGDLVDADAIQAVLDRTGADAAMIGRGAQGDPWIFQRIGRGLGYLPPGPEVLPQERLETIQGHIAAIHHHYGPQTGARVARKHIRWYLERLPVARHAVRALLREADPGAQLFSLERTLRGVFNLEFAA